MKEPEEGPGRAPTQGPAQAPKPSPALTPLSSADIPSPPASPYKDSTSLLDDLISHQHSVFSLCLGYARDAAQAEEWAQESYLKALKSAPGLKDRGAAKVWLCRIAKHTCLDQLKKERLGREALLASNPRTVDDRSPETLALELDELRLVKQAVRRLPKKLRDAFVLREYAELAYDEIAEALGCRRGTVMSRLNRARRQLAGFLAERKNEK